MEKKLCGYSTLNENGVKPVDNDCRWCERVNYETCITYMGQKHFLFNELIKSFNDAFEEIDRKRPGRR